MWIYIPRKVVFILKQGSARYCARSIFTFSCVVWSMAVQYSALSIYFGIWASFHYKDRLFKYGHFRFKDETVVKPSYLYNGNFYTDKTASLHWDGALFSKCSIYEFMHVVWTDGQLSPWHIVFSIVLYSTVTNQESTMISAVGVSGCHYDGIIWTACSLKPQVNRLFV